MTENRRRMDESGHNHSTSRRFDDDFFTINGVPLKFHLEGYDPTEFNEIVATIEAFGAKLSPPDDPDTFIFCEPDYQIGAGDYDRYNIEYFSDSVDARQLQRLINYRLPRTTNQHIESSVDDNGSAQVDNEAEDTDFTLRMSSDEDDDQSPQLENKELTNSYRNGIDHGRESVSNDIDCIDLCSSDTEDLNELTNEGNSCRNARAIDNSRVTESFSDLNDNEIAGPRRHPRTNNRYSNYHDEIDEDSCQNAPEDDADSFDSNIENVNHSQNVLRHTFGRRRERPCFTEEENQTIIKWLMDKKVVPLDQGKIIWRKFLQEKVLPERELTVLQLSSHYRYKLKKHPIFVKYVEDAKNAGVELDCGGVPLVPYTKAEDQVMINYLIENDVIHRARTVSVWAECFEVCKSSLHPSRTARKLFDHFTKILIKNYAKYTKNPKALMKFQQVEKIRRKKK